MRKIALFAAALTALAAAIARTRSPDAFAEMPKDKACVAWKARKRFWMVWPSDAVGVSCEVSVRAVRTAGGRSVRVSFPVASLRSGEPFRDFLVQQCLGRDRAPVIEFISRPYSADDWAALREGRIRELEGRLEVSGAFFPLQLPFSVVGPPAKAAAQGEIVTSLKTFQISGRLGRKYVMQLEDAVELDYRVPLSSLEPRA